MKAAAAHSSWRIGAVALAALAAAMAVAVLFVFDPATAGIYPVCALHAMTGLQCPGCGGLRAMHQFLHGNIGAAWRLNPFAVALLPAALWVGLREIARVSAGRPWRGVAIRPFFGWLLAGALVFFGILRNAPLHPRP
jgi:hypothetical protein